MPLLMAVAFVIDMREIYREDFATEVSGKVIGFARARHGGETPIVEYLSLDGNIHRFHSRFYTHPRMYDIGDNVDVLYWESNPEDGSIKGWGFFESGALGLLGLFAWLMFNFQADWLEHRSKRP